MTIPPSRREDDYVPLKTPEPPYFTVVRRDGQPITDPKEQAVADALAKLMSEHWLDWPEQ